MHAPSRAGIVAAVALALAGGGAPQGTQAAANASSALSEAQRLLARSDTLQAIRVLEHSHLRDHSDPRAYLLLGRLLRERGTIEARLRSQRVLEDAHARFGGDESVLMELGRTYYAQRFYPDGLACFRCVLDADPHNCAARYMVGLYHYRNWKRMNQFDDDLRAARRELRAAVDCNPGDADAALLYLYASYALGDSCAADCDRFLARHPERAEFHLFHGLLDFDAGRYAECDARFRRGLSLLDPAQRDAYFSPFTVLPVPERDEFEDAPPDGRAVMQRGYWIAADPDPTTTLNERELEHIYRMVAADVLFSHAASGRPGWDTDRGEVFVKLGRPLTVDHSLGDDFATGQVETWSYVLGGSFCQFVFIDEFLNGNPRIPYDLDVTLAFVRHTPALSGVRDPSAAVPAAVDVTAFRDSELSSSVYLAVEVDADSLRAAVDLSRVNRFVLRGACFDLAWNRESAFADTAWTSGIPEHVASHRHAFQWVRRIELAFDRYHIACAFEDEGARARAQARGDADAARFLGDGLALSDVLLFDPSAAGEGESSRALAGIDRGGSSMRPRVGHRYGPGEALNAYVEVYNLSVARGASVYDVRYAIYPADDDDIPAWLEWGRRVARFAGIGDGEPVVSQSFRREGHDHVGAERLAIDVGALSPGRYRLLVEVTDARSGARAVSHTPLVKDGAPVAHRR